jgi:hypothetical protein
VGCASVITPALASLEIQRLGLHLVCATFGSAPEAVSPKRLMPSSRRGSTGATMLTRHREEITVSTVLARKRRAVQPVDAL